MLMLSNGGEMRGRDRSFDVADEGGGGGCRYLSGFLSSIDLNQLKIIVITKC